MESRTHALKSNIQELLVQVHIFIIINQIYSTYDFLWFIKQAAIKKEREQGEGSALLPQHQGIRICGQQGYHQSTLTLQQLLQEQQLLSPATKGYIILKFRSENQS